MKIQRRAYRDRQGRARQTERFYCVFEDHLGRRQRIPAFPDEKASAQLGGMLDYLVVCKERRSVPDRDVRKWVAGLRPQLAQRIVRTGLLEIPDVAGARPLDADLEHWEESLEAKEATHKHVKLAVKRARAIIEGCGFEAWGDISAHQVETWLKAQRDGAGIGKQTSNYYLRAIRQFCKWMVDNRRATESPVAHLKRLNVADDIRRDRRALSADECRRLVQAAATGREFCRNYVGNDGKMHQVRRGIPGVERALVYRLALETGLRAGELRSLTVASFALAGRAPTVTVSAASSKHRQADMLPLRSDTAAVLRERFARKLPAAKALHVPARTAEMLRFDLEAAGIPHEDTGAGVVDFHALRHTFCTNLANGGIHPSIVQALARHSTITLTMDRYTHVQVADRARALQALPDLSAPVAAEVRATGTDGRGAVENVAPNDGEIEGHNGSERDDLGLVRSGRGGAIGGTQGEEDPIESGVFAPTDAKGNGEGSRTRTCDTRLKRPLLCRLSYAPVRT